MTFQDAGFTCFKHAGYTINLFYMKLFKIYMQFEPSIIRGPDANKCNLDSYSFRPVNNSVSLRPSTYESQFPFDFSHWSSQPPHLLFCFIVFFLFLFFILEKLSGSNIKNYLSIILYIYDIRDIKRNFLFC